MMLFGAVLWKIACIKIMSKDTMSFTVSTSLVGCNKSKWKDVKHKVDSKEEF